MPVEFWTAGPMQYAVAQGAGMPLTQALASDQTCTDINTDQNSPLDSVPHVSVNICSRLHQATQSKLLFLCVLFYFRTCSGLTGFTYGKR